jgi:hypothetical protein
MVGLVEEVPSSNYIGRLVPLPYIFVMLSIEAFTTCSQARKDLSAVEEEPFDAITDKIPEKPMTFAEGASYSLVILAGLGIAAVAGYAVFKELIFEPKE